MLNILLKNYLNTNTTVYKKVGYMNKRTVDFCGKQSTLVVISNTREKLLNRDFYCLISTELKIYTEIFRSYKDRFKIEFFLEI